MIIGSAFDPQKKRAIRRARSELFERVFARFTVWNETKWGHNEKIEVLKWPEHTFACEIPIEKIILGHPRASSDLTMDGTGFAWHANYKAAICHGVAECIERHITAEIWYENRKIQCIKKYNYEGHSISVYTIVERAAVPYVLVTLSVPEVCETYGSAIKESMSEAVHAAIMEAAMLAEDALKGRLGEEQHSASADIVLSLRNIEMIAARRKWLEKKCRKEVGNVDWFRKTSLKEVVCLLRTRAYYTILVDHPGECLVRAYLDGGKTPRLFRELGSEILADPFA